MQKHRDIETVRTDSANPVKRLRRSYRQTNRCSRGVLLLLTALILWCASKPATAQSAYDPGGLFVHPTAYIPPVRQISVYAAAFTQDQGGVINYFYPLSVTYAPTDRLQLSTITVYHQAGGDPSHVHLGGFVKYQILPDSARHPAVAITGSYVSHDELETSFAAVASHRFVHNGRELFTAHLGVEWAHNGGMAGMMVIPGNDTGEFVGLSYPLTREWNLVGETSTKLSFEIAPASGIGLMYRPHHQLGITIGLVNDGRSSRLEPFFGVAYPLGR